MSPKMGSGSPPRAAPPSPLLMLRMASPCGVSVGSGASRCPATPATQQWGGEGDTSPSQGGGPQPYNPPPPPPGGFVATHSMLSVLQPRQCPKNHSSAHEPPNAPPNPKYSPKWGANPPHPHPKTLSGEGSPPSPASSPRRPPRPNQSPAMAPTNPKPQGNAPQKPLYGAAGPTPGG